MTIKDQIYNWLTIAVQQPPDKFSEIFYYDETASEFFSVLVTDYFLFDDDLNLAKNTASGYSQATLEILQNKIKRIDRNDPQIILLPRHGNIEEKSSVYNFINAFLREHKINIDNSTIWDPEEGNGQITIDLSDE